MKVLSLSTVFPRPGEENLGLFVYRRLEAMARYCDIEVVAPVPWIDYGNPSSRTGHLASTPAWRELGPLPVSYPRFLHPPGGTFVVPFAMAACVAGRIGQIRRRFDFDLIDAHFGFPESIAAALLAQRFNRPFTVTLRGNEPAHGRAGMKRRLLGWALRRAARVISVSARLSDFAVSLGVPRQRCAVIPNGIAPDLFHPRDRAAKRSEIGMNPNSLHLLSVGYLIERKGHHRVVKALAGLRRQGIPAELWIVGNAGREGRFEDRLRQCVEDCGASRSVHFIPAVKPDLLAGYMTACDVFCLASSREGWPNAIHEAQACGAPVVATDVGGAPDMIPCDDYGLIVAPGDDEALESALRTALTRQWDRAAIAAWGGMRTWDRVASETVVNLAAACQRTGSPGNGANGTGGGAG